MLTGHGSWLVMILVAGLVVGLSCGSDDDGDVGAAGGLGGGGQSPDRTGQACELAEDCYPGVDPATLSGERRCLEDVPNGYCTHVCEEDSDCCAVAGECVSELRQVCSPFESRPERYCFLACEEADLRPAADAGTTTVDADEFCRREANPSFFCRSTGGGGDNRRVCMPGELCGDSALVVAYPACVAATGPDACQAAGGVWAGAGCWCPTGQEACTCTRAGQCLAHCAAPVPVGGDCSTVDEKLCTPTTSPTGCWCVFDDSGAATERCFD